MNYDESIEYLFAQYPAFQRVGGSAYKPGLDTSRALAALYGNPQRAYRCIHVAGTNGKGSVSHTLAAVLQLSGYKVGLYTSPHLVDFRERIRVNGQKVDRQYVTDFVNDFRGRGFDGSPSFFELTMVMAFDYFRREQVDVAVIEVGLGGRLDSTNIISPDLCVITNISLDHTQFLGDTLEKIAAEKAGIMKSGVPVVIGEAEGGVRRVFERTAAVVGAPVTFAQDVPEVTRWRCAGGKLEYVTRSHGTVVGELAGACQVHNANTLLVALDVLSRQCGFAVGEQELKRGFRQVCLLTGLMGRWMTVSEVPLTVCDTGHNVGGWEYISTQLSQAASFGRQVYVIIGFVSDKDIGHILDMMPRQHNVHYCFTQAQIPRAQSSEVVCSMAAAKGIVGEHFETVEAAYRTALACSTVDDMIFVGGSTFVVADFLACIGYDK